MTVRSEEDATVDENTGKCAVILDRTTFYHEAGGQVSDTGVITIGDVTSFEVEDVQSLPTGHILHIGRQALFFVHLTFFRL